MKVKLNLNWKTLYEGTEIDIPIPCETPSQFSKGCTNLWKSKVTIYNDLPATADTPRRFERFVIERCQIQGGYVDKASATIRNTVNAKTVITKDVERYKTPVEYRQLPENERTGCFTVQVGDYIVFGEIDDTVANASDFAALQTKYKDCGIKVASVNASINGMAVDNITMSNV